MKNTVEIINISDITVSFKDRLFDLKTTPQVELTKQALKHITYKTNMWVYSNICKYDGVLIEYKTQTTDEINNFTIHFLN